MADETPVDPAEIIARALLDWRSDVERAAEARAGSYPTPRTAEDVARAALAALQAAGYYVGRIVKKERVPFFIEDDDAAPPSS